MLLKGDGARQHRAEHQSWQEALLIRHHHQLREELAQELRRNGNLGTPGPVISRYSGNPRRAD